MYKKMEPGTRNINALNLAFKLLDELNDEDNSEHRANIFITRERLNQMIRDCEFQYPDE